MFDHVTVKLKKKNPRAEFGVINLSQALRPGPQSPVAAPPPGWHVCGIEMCEAFCPACSRELFSALRRGRKGESRNQSPVPGVWTYTVIRGFFFLHWLFSLICIVSVMSDSRSELTQ